jgi:hypothetical protein
MSLRTDTIYEEYWDEETCKDIRYRCSTSYFGTIETKTVEQWWSNGILKSREHSVDGILDDEQVEYYSNGVILTRCMYINGSQQGIYIQNYANGDIMIRGKYVDGLKEGLWIYGSLDPSRIISGTYRNDVKTGEWVTRNGSKQTIEVFDKGELVDKSVRQQMVKAALSSSLDQAWAYAIQVLENTLRVCIPLAFHQHPSIRLFFFCTQV